MARKAFAAVALTVTAGILLSGCAGGAGDSADNTIDGEVKGDLKVITWRTDLVEDGTFDKYAAEFNKKYPDVKVTFEAITDYSGEMLTRMSTDNFGDVIGIPAIQPDQYDQFLEPLGDTADFEDTYRFLPAASYDGTQYGIAWGGNANGVIYNKKVFEEAGITACRPPRTSGSTPCRRSRTTPTPSRCTRTTRTAGRSRRASATSAS